MDLTPALVVQTLQKKIDESPRFKSIIPGLGGHHHTFGGYFLRQPRALNTFKDTFKERTQNHIETVRIQTLDGDTLVGVMHVAQEGPRGVLHAFHGLAGSSDSTYMPRIAEVALGLGLTVVLWNHRGCGPGRKLAKHPYHSGRSDDLGRAVAWGRKQFPHLKQILLGYSLSANATVLLSAGVIPSHDSRPLTKRGLQEVAWAELPDLSIAVNPPIDLEKSALRLSHGPAKVYGQRFIVDLLQSLHDRAGTPHADQALRQLDKSFATLRFSVFDFDAAYTGIAGGFRDHRDYYHRASCGRYLTQSQIPLVVLTSEDDPITCGLSDLETPLDRRTHRNSLALDIQSEGGHMGYIDLNSIRAAWDAERRRWMEERIAMYLMSYLNLMTPSSERMLS